MKPFSLAVGGGLAPELLLFIDTMWTHPLGTTGIKCPLMPMSAPISDGATQTLRQALKDDARDMLENRPDQFWSMIDRLFVGVYVPLT
jgi:hypothetical protein